MFDEGQGWGALSASRTRGSSEPLLQLDPGTPFGSNVQRFRSVCGWLAVIIV